MSDNNIRESEYSQVNTFTTASARRLSGEALSYPEMYPHEVAELFDSDISEGLDKKSVKRNRALYGDNSETDVPIGFKLSLIRQSKNLVTVFCLLSCLLFYLFRKDIWLLAVAGGLIVTVFVNAFLEYKANEIFVNCKNRASARATVIREGKTFVTSSRSLVPGDIIILETDCIVPADARLIEASGFTVLETPVNNIKESVVKDARFLATDIKRRVYENMVYRSSVVTGGRATAVVCATGKDALINKRKPTDPVSMLPKHLKTVMKVGRLTAFTAVLAELILLLSGMLKGSGLADTFIISLSVGASSLCDTAFALAVAAEANGIEEAMKKGCVFRNLNSFDKIAEADTVMCEKNIAFPPEKVSLKNIYTCFELHEFTRQSKSVTLDIVRSMLLCSTLKEVFIEKKVKKKRIKEVKYEGGDYSLALVEAAKEAGYTLEDAQKGFFKIDTEFDSHGEAVRVLGLLNGKPCVILRGSPQNVLSRCVGYRFNGKNIRLDQKSRDRIMADAADMVKTQIPIAIAMGYTEAESLHDINCEKKLIFLGFAGFHTATRIDGASSVYRFNSSGIDIAVRTDDSYYTAYNLAKNTGVVSSEAEICTRDILHDTEEGLFIADNENYKLFTDLTDEEWLYILSIRRQNKHKVFASVSQLSQLPIVEEADATFAVADTGGDALLSTCDVRLAEGGFNSVEGVMKQSKLIIKRISNISQYMSTGFLTLFFWTFFSIIFNGRLPLRLSDVFVFGFVINPMFSFALALAPENRKTLSEKASALSPQSISKGFLISLFYSMVSAVLCIVSAGITGGSFTDGVSASVITYTLSLFMFSLMAGETHSLLTNRFYRNYYLFISFAAGSILTAIAIYVPSVRTVLGYSFVSLPDLAVATGLPLIFFLAIQLLLLIFKRKNK